MKHLPVIIGVLWLFVAAHSWLKFFGGPTLYWGWALLLFALTALGLYGAGGGAAKIFDVEPQDLPRKIALNITLGLCLLAYAMLGLGALRLYYPAAAALVLGAMLWAGKDRFTALGQLRCSGCRYRPLAFFIAAIALLTFVYTLVPPHQYDSLVYHLALPQAYMQNHALTAIPQIFYSHFPQNAEMVFTYALLLGSDLLPQMLMWLCAAGSCLWAYSYASRTAAGALLAVALICIHTALMLLGVTSYIEAFVMLLTTACAVLFFEWAAAAHDNTPSGQLLLAGVFAGAAFGAKYYAGLTIAVIFALAVYKIFTIGWFSKRKQSFFQLAGFCAAAAAMYLPWAVKNITETGNPVFPFFYRIFNAGSAKITIEPARRFFDILSQYKYEGSFAGEFFKFPYLAATSPEKFGGGMDVLGILGWEALLAGALFMAYAVWKNKTLRYAAAYLAIYWVLWLFTGKVLRFLTVAVPLASVLAADGLTQCWRQNGKAVKLLIAGGLVIFTAARLLLFTHVQNTVDAQKVLSGVQTPVEYLAQRLDYYPCAYAANRLTPPQSNILIAGEQRSFYLQRRCTPSSVYVDNRYVALANAAKTPQELREKLAAEGFTHFINVPAEARRLRYYGTMPFDYNGAHKWEELLSDSKPLFQAKGCALYGLQ